jgi:hypothetical protein
MNKIPTILPKTVKPYMEKVRDTYNSKGLRKTLPKILTKTIMFREEDKLRELKIIDYCKQFSLSQWLLNLIKFG